MKSFKQMIACNGMLLGFLLLSVNHPVQRQIASRGKITIVPIGTGMQDTDTPRKAGVQVYPFN